MREIKFRFWDAKENRWLGKESSYWKQLTFEDCKGRLLASLRQGDIVAEQYISLEDESGKEIYEGDIIKAQYYDGAQANNRRPAKVVWSDFDLCFVARFREEREEGGFYYLPEDMPINAGNMEGVKVIGNVHENPELLGGEE